MLQMLRYREASLRQCVQDAFPILRSTYTGHGAAHLWPQGLEGVGRRIQSPESTIHVNYFMSSRPAPPPPEMPYKIQQWQQQ